MSPVTLISQGVSRSAAVLTHSLQSTPLPFSTDTSAMLFSAAGMKTVAVSPVRYDFLSIENESIEGASGSFLSALPLYAGQSAKNVPPVQCPLLRSFT